MPKIEMIRLSQSLRKEYEGRPNGVIGDFADEDGERKFTSDDAVTIEMNPKEAAEKGLFVIAITSELFKGHLRGAGYYGEKRRLVVIGKDGVGSIQLSSYESLRVTVKNSLQGKK